MKGIIFNLVEDVVSNEYGSDTWDALLDDAGLDGAYTSLGSYPDEDVSKLVASAAKALGVPTEAVLRKLGEGALPLLATRYPQFFQPHASARSFVLTLNDIIHPEVRKLYPGADVPEFDFDSSDGDVLVIGYQSPRRLCALAEGFILGAAAHYGETAEVEHVRCMNSGAESCVMPCLFRALARDTA